MNRLLRNSLLALLLTLGWYTAWGQPADLGTLPGGTWAEMWDINDFGLVVGMGDNRDGNLRPIAVSLRGSQSLQWIDLGTLGGETTECCWVMCMEVADSGLIVGHTLTAEGHVHAFAWTPTSGMIDIGTIEGHSDSAAYGVNKGGSIIVGFSGVDLDHVVPVAWMPDGPGGSWKIHRLDTEGFGVVAGWANTVNDAGQIVGAGDTETVRIPFLWNPVPGRSEWKVLRLGVPSGYPNAGAKDINRTGEIAGWVAAPDWSTALPALWTPVAPEGTPPKLTVLPTLSGLEQGWNLANGINDAGDIVGVSNDADWNWLAARWSTKHPQFVQVLGFPGDWSLASKVNDNGVAAGGFGFNDSPEERAVAVRFR